MTSRKRKGAASEEETEGEHSGEKKGNTAWKGSMCKINYCDGAEPVMVQLDCKGMHTFCAACLKRHVEANTKETDQGLVSTFQCPICRGNLLGTLDIKMINEEVFPFRALFCLSVIFFTL
jgi:hypothetical protein